jgi:hypothetical protein
MDIETFSVLLGRETRPSGMHQRLFRRGEAPITSSMELRPIVVTLDVQAMPKDGGAFFFTIPSILLTFFATIFASSLVSFLFLVASHMTANDGFKDFTWALYTEESPRRAGSRRRTTTP